MTLNVTGLVQLSDKVIDYIACEGLDEVENCKLRLEFLIAPPYDNPALLTTSYNLT